MRINLTSHYLTMAIPHIIVSTDEFSVGFVAIHAVDQRVDVVLTRYLTG